MSEEGGAPNAGAVTPSETTVDVKVSADGGTGKAAPSAEAGSDWTTGLSDDLRGYVETKGFKDPSAVLDSYRNLEKLTGVPKERLLRLPENLEDADGMKEIYGRLGRPEAPDGYKIEVPEGASKDFSEWAQKSFHDLGLSKAQGEKLANNWNEYVKNLTEAETTQAAQKIEADTNALKKEWGQAYEQELGKAKQAAREFGLTAEVIDQLETSMGFAGVMKFFNKIGSKLGEAPFVSGDSRRSFDGVMTPAAALNKIASLKQDTEWVKRYSGGDVAAREQFEKLHQMAYPE